MKSPQNSVSRLLLLVTNQLGRTLSAWQRLHSGEWYTGRGWLGRGRQCRPAGPPSFVFQASRSCSHHWARSTATVGWVPMDGLCLLWPSVPPPTTVHVPCCGRKPQPTHTLHHSLSHRHPHTPSPRKAGSPGNTLKWGASKCSSYNFLCPSLSLAS